VAVDAPSSSVMRPIADAVAKGECILFLGAGVHYPPPAGSSYVYPEEHRPPLGAALSEALARDCDFAKRLPNESPTNLQRVALCYELEHSRKRLVDEVRRAVQTGKRPSSVLCALAELDFPFVVTTNYDQLFERALTAAGKEPRLSIYSPELRATEDHGPPTADSPVVFKIHGDIGHPESIVITDEDYIQFVLRMSNKDPWDPVPLAFKYHFKVWPTLFVGYSLLDYNLRLLFKTLRWKIDNAVFPDTYSIDLKPDPLIFEVWHNQRRYVRFIAEDVWAFVPSLYRMVRNKELPDSCG
jgi:SIR2-like domain